MEKRDFISAQVGGENLEGFLRDQLARKGRTHGLGDGNLSSTSEFSRGHHTPIHQGKRTLSHTNEEKRGEKD